MAEGLHSSFCADTKVYSAGMKPEKVNPFSIKSMDIESREGDTDRPLNLSIFTSRTFPNKGFLTCIITILLE